MTHISSISPLNLDCSFCRTTIATENTETPHDCLTRAINVNKGTVNLCVLFGKQPYRPIRYGPQAAAWGRVAALRTGGHTARSLRDSQVTSPLLPGQPVQPLVCPLLLRTSHTASGHHPSGVHLYSVSESVVGNEKHLGE